jgi:hypothetical protein
MGGQIGLSTAARDRRIKAVAEFFTSWPGTLPYEPIADLPPVLLLNGTVDPIIPLDWAFMLDGLLKERRMPYERHLYQGLGHGFGTEAAFRDGVARTSAFFGGRVGDLSTDPDLTESDRPIQSLAGSGEMVVEYRDANGWFDSEDLFAWWSQSAPATLVSKKKRRLTVAKNPAVTHPAGSPQKITKP